jgi:predicted RNase H-like HicB family nuclease
LIAGQPKGKGEHMKRSFTATVWQEGNWFVAQCLEVDVASQGENQEEALRNLREALELHFEPPHATESPRIKTIQVDLDAA